MERRPKNPGAGWRIPNRTAIRFRALRPWPVAARRSEKQGPPAMRNGRELNYEKFTGPPESVIRNSMIQPEELVGEEWAEWYRLTPAQRWLESEKLWQIYLALGGSLDPEPDTQSPFFNAKAPRPRPSHGRTGVRVLRRGRV